MGQRNPRAKKTLSTSTFINIVNMSVNYKTSCREICKYVLKALEFCTFLIQQFHSLF